MGLDMYLERVGIDGKKTEVCYWRKANAIFGWLQRNLESVKTQVITDEEVENMSGIDKSYGFSIINCKEYEVIKDELEQLVTDCREVIAKYQQKNLVADDVGDLLPVEGFFFGSTELDECYLADLKNTIEYCQAVIDETDWTKEKIYFYAWW